MHVVWGGDNEKNPEEPYMTEEDKLLLITEKDPTVK